MNTQQQTPGKAAAGKKPEEKEKEKSGEMKSGKPGEKEDKSGGCSTCG